MLADAGLTISEAIKGEKPCGGHGKCGKCKVIVKGSVSALTVAEQDLLTADEIKDGVRLACLTLVEGDCEIVTQSHGEGSQIVTYAELP